MLLELEIERTQTQTGMERVERQQWWWRRWRKQANRQAGSSHSISVLKEYARRKCGDLFVKHWTKNNLLNKISKALAVSNSVPLWRKRTDFFISDFGAVNKNIKVKQNSSLGFKIHFVISLPGFIFSWIFIFF